MKIALAVLLYIIIGFIVAGICLAVRILTKYQVYPGLYKKRDSSPLKYMSSPSSSYEANNDLDNMAAAWSMMIVMFWPLLPFIFAFFIFKDNIRSWCIAAFYRLPLKIATTLFRKKINGKFAWDWMKK